MVSEQALHISVARYLDLALPPGIAWTTIGHGGGGKLRGAFLQKMGVKPGWPDIHICAAGRCRYIELKTEKGRLSPAQKDAHEAIERAGGTVAVCRSIDEVEKTLKGWGIPLRTRAA